jgi:hypothetical protein
LPKVRPTDESWERETKTARKRGQERIIGKKKGLKRKRKKIPTCRLYLYYMLPWKAKPLVSYLRDNNTNTSGVNAGFPCLLAGSFFYYNDREVS